MNTAAPSPDPWAALLNGLPDAAWLVGLQDHCVVAANQAAADFFGQPAAQLVGQPALALAVSPEDMAFWDACAQGERGSLLSHTLVSAADGRQMHASRSIRMVADSHALVMLRDRSQEAHAERERDSLVSELQATLESTADGILVTDLFGRIRAFNRRFAQIWGLPLELLQGQDDAAVHNWLTENVVDSANYLQRLHALNAGALLHASDKLRLHSGQSLERVTRPLFTGGQASGRVWSFRDLTERVAADERIEALTFRDALTGLPNRRRLGDRYGEIAAAAKTAGKSFALLVIDLDQFRQINDSLGHDVGDQVLLDTGRRMQGCLREHDMLARIGGDQFAVLLYPADSKAAEASARRLLNVVAQPCSVAGAQFTLTCSIGMALYPSHGSSIDDLLRHAESAMRAVKQAGRSNFRLHQVRAEGDRRSHMRLDHAMRQALVSNRFRLHYQPQVRLADGCIVGAEALLRWRDPELGEVAPGLFIPVAEDSGFIVAIGDWVLAQAVRQAALWHQRGRAVPMAVNVSALQFQQTQFVDRVAHVLAVSGLPPHLLELELTESILVHDAADALLRLGALSQLGVRLSIDDFGTGYSSLAYLKRFPIDKLKIDRSFVNGLPGDDSDVGIVRAILQMAQALGMKVVAEGVETETQRQFLLEAGCNEFQGFLFSPAVDGISFERLLASPGMQPQTPAVQEKPRIRLVRS
jgi:diguanylate cyclase (GGDEF)-like protein/PAS domain S-box-containing protein